MDKWYALQTTTGAELDVRERLSRLGYPVMLPVRIIPERSGGVWRQSYKVMLPGYILVQTVMKAADWHCIRQMPDVLRILGGMQPAPLSDTETARMRWLDNGGAPWTISEGTLRDGALHITSGPLTGCEHEILSIDARRNRVRIRTGILGEERSIELGLILRYNDKTISSQ